MHVKGAGGRELPPPVTVSDEYLAEILRNQQEILEILRQGAPKPLPTPEATTQVKEPARKRKE